MKTRKQIKNFKVPIAIGNEYQVVTLILKRKYIK